MNEPKFTPGPWYLEFNCNLPVKNQKCVVYDKHIRDDGFDWDGSVVCHLTNGYNARLITAAPDLYGALERQTDNMAFIMNHFNIPQEWYTKFTREIDQDREVLTKARGDGL